MSVKEDNHSYYAQFLTLNSQQAVSASLTEEKFEEAIDRLFSHEGFEQFVLYDPEKTRLISVVINYNPEQSSKKLLHVHALVEMTYKGTRPRLDWSGIKNAAQYLLGLPSLYFKADSSAESDRNYRLHYIFKGSPHKDQIYKALGI